MAQVKVNFDVDNELKAKFETAIKVQGFSTMAEAFRDYMRKTISVSHDPNNPPVISRSVPNQA